MPEPVPSFDDAATPAQLAAAMATWATGSPDRLEAALHEGNGATTNAFVRRLTDADLRALNDRVNELAVFKEMRRRGL